MLQSYQAILNGNSLHWIDEIPHRDNIEVIVTILPKSFEHKKVKRQAPSELKGMAVFTGDLIDTSEIEQSWDMLK